MDNNYRKLGLTPGAEVPQVAEAYRKLSRQYNPDNFADPAQKKWAKQQMDEINAAFDAIMNSKREGVDTAQQPKKETNDRDEFYVYIRRLIQHGDYDTALQQLNAYPNENEAEWQFLMASAMYYRGYISGSFEFFKRAAEMEPTNKEYTATYNRMRQNRNGEIHNSPYTQQQTYSGGMVCCDPCTVCQCLMCMDCLCR